MNFDIGTEIKIDRSSMINLGLVIAVSLTVVVFAYMLATTKKSA